MIPQYRIEQYLNAINAAYLGDSPLPEYPSEPVWRIEGFLAAILSAVKGDSPVMACPDPVWHIEEFARAIYDALVGASPAWPCPTATNNIEAILHAIYKVVADGTETDDIMTSWDIEKWLMDSYDAAKEGGGTKTTLSGNLPLTLANALSHAIVSLTRYGLCTQDGTPTPSDPVPIKCNNGVLTMADDELPAGYKRLIGITFDGNIRYETGEYLTGDDDVTMTLNNISSSGKNLFGSYNGANDKNFSMYIYGSSTSGSYFRYGDQLKRPKYGETGQRTITFGKSGTSGFAENSTVDPDEFTTQANTYIGMLPNSSSAAFTGDIIGSITVSNRLEWIPCERESDGVIGYYEKYNGNFIAPTGSGTPVSLGYDTSHMTVLSIVGTPEVLTVDGPNLLNTATNITGKYITASGGISNGDDAQYTDLIPVAAGEVYVWSLVSNRPDGGNNRLHGYNSAGNWVQQIKWGNPGQGLGLPFSLKAVIPNGISYVRLSYGINDTDAMISPATSKNWEGYYPIQNYASNKAGIDTSTVIQSPYTTPARNRGPAVLCKVEQGNIYVVESTVTADKHFVKHAVFYSSKDDVTNNKNAIGFKPLDGQVSSFEPVSGTAYAVIACSAIEGTTFTFDSNSIKVFYADAEYQPYVPPQTASVPMLLSVGEYKDEQDIISGTVTRKCGVLVIDGTEGWALTQTANVYIANNLAANALKSDTTSACLCTHYKGVAPSIGAPGMGALSIKMGYGGEGGSEVARNRVYLNDTTVGSADGLINFLKAQYAAGTPVMVIYPLATPSTEQTTAQHLVTSEGTNVVDSVANVGPLTAEVTYKANA